MELQLKMQGFLWENGNPKGIHRVRVIGLSKSAIQFSTPVPETYQTSIAAFNIILLKTNFLADWTFEVLDETQSVKVKPTAQN